MTRKPKLTDKQIALKERIVKVYTQSCGFRYHHPGWGEKMWSKPTAEVYEYLENRMQDTMDEIEYYACMVYLYHVIPDNELFVEFGELQRVIEARSGFGEYDDMGEITLSNRIKQRATELNTTVVSGVKVLGSVPILGGL